ncbi:protein Turandot E-like [Drosophila rhopaloa]|uniref:Protein Turandot E-like n=1 Tax=Drosophila rhopaloa TaxID=1041015 RepID=A0A6P4EQ31_DRORH|nr:protein Turandot E-like [Drosophila rhopaloa]
MSSIIQVGCFLIVLGCILGTGLAQSDAEFTAKAREMLAVYGNPAVDQNTQYRNLPQLVEFYEKYYDRIHLTDQERQRANELLTRYRTEKANQVYVDGVPAQGGFRRTVLTEIAVGLAVSAAGEVLKRASSSGSTIQISREMGILGIIFLIAIYKLRSKF